MITLPDSQIRVLGPVPELDFFDSQTKDLGQGMTALSFWALSMRHQSRVIGLAFKIRDVISALFGVKKIGGFSGRVPPQVEVGSYIDFFLVEYISDDVLILTERDRHLDVMTCVSMQGSEVTITSSVDVHNWFGHAYMVPVGIAHRWIVRSILNRVAKNL